VEAEESVGGEDGRGVRGRGALGAGDRRSGSETRGRRGWLGLLEEEGERRERRDLRGSLGRVL
jgi:hypothetical protein